ncbi:MAG: glucose-1-phosphate adenylyltransferase, partial [Candidatus Binatia bacterium]
SVVAEGTIVSGSRVHNCIIGRNVRIHSYGRIENSVIGDWVEIGRNCRIRNAIIDKANVIASGTEIGYDAARDRERYFVSPSGIVVLARGPRKTTWLMANP